MHKTDNDLLEAAKDGDVDSVARLLKQPDCNLDAGDHKRRTALQWAAFSGHVDIVQLLISAGAQVDSCDTRGWTPLHEAAAFGRLESVRLLMRGEADPNLGTIGEGNSPLHLASERDHHEVVSCLLAFGRVDTNLTTADGRSAAHKAARQGCAKSLELLLLHGSADPNLRSIKGQTPLHHAALSDDKGQCVHKLLSVNAADLDALDDQGFSPLHLAAACGREAALEHLLLAGCRVTAGLRTGAMAPLSPAELAAGFGHNAVLLRLLRHSDLSDRISLPPSTEQMMLRINNLLDDHHREQQFPNAGIDLHNDESLSVELHNAMNAAGFTQERARLQSAVSDALQDIVRNRWRRGNHIVGSFADGWGNSLFRLNGLTDADADIDLTRILKWPMLHIEGFCACDRKSDRKVVQYTNGHVRYSGRESNPAGKFSASAMRPAVDIIRATPCCSYPAIRDWLPTGRALQATQIPSSTLALLNDEMSTSQCHLVTAAPPKQEGLQLRVSTSFLERRLMRSLTSVQGQVFVLLYTLKRLLSDLASGVKTYHAKTLLFYLLDETPTDKWQPNQLLSITRMALEKLCQSLVQNESELDQCMQHFFLRDAWLYLKNGHRDKAKIHSELKQIIEQLPQLMWNYKSCLQPLQNNQFFPFHPFVVIPEARPRPLPQSGQVGYHNLPDIVSEMLKLLSFKKCNEISRESLLTVAGTIPNFARTARHCLTALTHLKFGDRASAEALLREVVHDLPSSDVSHLDSSREPTAESIRQHLESKDSAWKFCLWFADAPPNLYFLPDYLDRTRRLFLTKMQLAQLWFINFCALLRCLSIELGIVADEATYAAWFEETVLTDRPDVQELLMTLEFCSETAQLSKLIEKHRLTICDLQVTRLKTIELLSAMPHLLSYRAGRALESIESVLSN